MKTALEAVLQAMVTGGWANESDGDVSSPTGHFARVSISPAELSECVDAFSDVLTAYPLDSSLLIGHWLVVEDDRGFIAVNGFDNPIELTRVFQKMQDEFAEWNED